MVVAPCGAQFFGQVARYLNIWEQDNTLMLALELAKSLLPPMEYLMSIYPSDRECLMLPSFRARSNRAVLFRSSTGAICSVTRAVDDVLCARGNIVPARGEL